MSEKENNDAFSYTYSAKEQEEIKEIRKKYVAESADDAASKMERLRALDRGVTKKGSLVALILGSVSTLIMGLGMSLVMSEFGSILGNVISKSSAAVTVAGIVLGILGMAGVVSAYPVYKAITKRQRRRVTPEIIRLTDELMK